MSQPPPPPPIEYRSPPPRPPAPPGGILRFFIGLGGGTVISAIAWAAMWNVPESAQGYLFYLIIIVPLVKLIVGIWLICYRKWRPMGIGLILSIALGTLIFLKECAANFKFGQ